MVSNYQITNLQNYQIQFDSPLPFCSPYRMELRKDPITRSWVITGDDVPESTPTTEACRFCPASSLPLQVISTLPGMDGTPWSARAVVHPQPLYHIEGDPSRRAD